MRVNLRSRAFSSGIFARTAVKCSALHAADQGLHCQKMIDERRELQTRQLSRASRASALVIVRLGPGQPDRFACSPQVRPISDSRVDVRRDTQTQFPGWSAVLALQM